MKKFSLSITLMLFIHFAFSQAPQLFNYQGVARNNSGVGLVNQSISIKASIISDSSNGTLQYSEFQNATTNQFGLFVIQIGAGTSLSGTFNTISWESGNKYLKIEFDPNGGTNYTAVGITQLVSVPFALNAASGGTRYLSGNGIQISSDTITNSAPDQVVTLTGTGGTTVTGSYPNFNIDSPIVPKTVAGTSSGGFNPTVITGTGFIVTRTGPGEYNVSFSTTYSTVPTVLTSVYNTNNTQIWLDEVIKAKDITTTGFTAITGLGSNAGSILSSDNIPFSFIAIGN